MTNTLQNRTRNRDLTYDNLIDNWFNRAFNTIFEDVDGDLFEGKLQTLADETEDAYIIKAEVPGLSHDDIDINYENNLLTLKAEWKEKEEKGLRRGKVQKSYTIYGVDADKITAKLDNGILKLTLPKSEKAKPKRIQIE